MTLIYLSLSWLAGVYLGLKLFWPWVWLGVGIASLPLVFLLRLRHRFLLLALLSLVALSAGALRLQDSLPPQGESSLTSYQGQKVTLTGRVKDIPLDSSRYQRLSLEARELTLEDRTRLVTGTALVWLPLYPAYHYGDRLAISGEMERLAKTGPSSDISALFFYPKAELLASGQGGSMEIVHSLRLRLASVLAQALPQPQAALAQGVLLGLRGGIPKNLNDSFIQSGTTHLLAISGLNISIFLGILLSLGAWALGRQHPYYLILAFLGLWLYILLSGLNPPVIRAGIMGSLLLAGLWLGRPAASLTALAFAAALMTGIEPGLLYQVSFQLSFAATAGLILLSPHFQAWGRRVFLPQPVNDALAYSLGAIIASYPLVVYHFHLFSLVSLPATLIAMPVLAPIILLSTLVAVAGLFFPFLAQIIGWVDWLFLSYLQEVATISASLPQAFLKVKEVSAVWLLAYYGTLGLILFVLSPRLDNPLRQLKGKWGQVYPRLPLRGMTLALIVPALLVWIAYFTLPDGRLHVSFLDVGQGDAILIQQGSRQILVDGGPDPQRLALALDRRLPFWDRSLDGIVLTHPQADHMAGLIGVLRRYKVGWALEPGVPSTTEGYKEWRRQVAEKQIPPFEARNGQKISLGPQESIEVLHPQQNFLKDTGEDVNNNSIVLRLEDGEVSFLLTADIQLEAEHELLFRSASLKSTVLKVAHHGSATSTSVAFLAVVQPQVAVISLAADNPFGHPSPQVIARLTQMLSQNRVFLTSERGDIELVTDGGRLRIKTER